MICCDIDGVIADVREYVKQYLPRDWKGYFAHTLEFPINQWAVNLLRGFYLNGIFTNLVTGRPESNRELTERWLYNIKGFPNQQGYNLYMRLNNDPRPTCDIKLQWYKQMQPDLIIDDDPEVIRVATQAGFVALQVHGYRITDTDMIPERE